MTRRSTVIISFPRKFFYLVAISVRAGYNPQALRFKFDTRHLRPEICSYRPAKANQNQTKMIIYIYIVNWLPGVARRSRGTDTVSDIVVGLDAAMVVLYLFLPRSLLPGPSLLKMTHKRERDRMTLFILLDFI